jgi:hypothetical protein
MTLPGISLSQPVVNYILTGSKFLFLGLSWRNNLPLQNNFTTEHKAFFTATENDAGRHNHCFIRVYLLGSR